MSTDELMEQVEDDVKRHGGEYLVARAVDDVIGYLGGVKNAKS